MRSFSYEALPGRVVFGAGSSRTALAAEAERLGAERILVIASRRERGLVQDLATPLGERVVGFFTDVRPHVPAEVAERAREVARRLAADCLLCVGGGSTIGTAKIVALENPLPIVAVPTTYSGSEMTPVWGTTRGQRKTTGRSPDVLPRAVVYDPELTLSLPPGITGPSAMNAMAHGVEALYAPDASPVASLMAEEGISALARGVVAAVAEPGSIEGRTETLYGAYLAGAAFASAGGGIHHKICHVLGGAYDLPHAETHTIVLPQAVAFNETAIPVVMARVAGALGVEGSPATALYDLASRIGAPVALREIGMREDDVDEAAELVLEAVPEGNPRPVDRAGVRDMLLDAYRGQRPAAGGDPSRGSWASTPSR